MCGIAGIISPNAKNYTGELIFMTDAIKHRGPDAEGHEFFDNAALGHRRLSIVDLSYSGAQPMYSNTKKECIVLNGEIYGFQSLKKKYNNYRYKGSSDTEVILAMYQAKGKDLIHELPGMFAFAIWDEEKQELFCARDRFGEKPFYYAKGKNGEFIFASEIKALLASKLIQPEINNEALSHYLQYGYVSTYQTIYKNIHTLPPAHTLVFKDKVVKTQRYYQIPHQDKTPIGLSEAKEQFEFLLKNAVQKQLIADVKVGSFLSGGLDSSSVVALVNDYLPEQTTISFGYDNDISELKFAKEISDKYQTHHVEVLEEKEDIATALQKVSPFFDEPFADMSYLPQYRISKAAKEHLTVILSGDAGDELFGGYNFYSVENKLKNHFSYNNSIAKFGLNLIKNIKQLSFVTQQNLKYDSILDFHQNHVRNYFNESEKEAFGINQKYHQKYSFTQNPNSLNDIMRTDLEKYVPANMMVKSDRMAMANSLEVRTPFLDVEFAEFCIQLPENLKLNHENDKIILRESMQKYWTESIRKRRKQGFGSDVETWLKEKKLLEMSDDLLKNKNHSIFKFIDFNTTQKHLDKGKKHWNLLQFALWAENSKNFF